MSYVAKWPLAMISNAFQRLIPPVKSSIFFCYFQFKRKLKFHICTEYCLGSQMFSQRCEAPYSLKSNNLRQFAPYRVTKKVYFKFVECIFFSIKCKNKKKEALQYLFKCNDNEQFVFVLCISNNYIWKKNTHDSLCFVYSYSTTQVNVTSKFLYVPGKGLHRRHCFDTTARFSITCFLTTIYDDVD